MQRSSNTRFYVLSFGTLVSRPYNGGVLNSEVRNREVPLYILVPRVCIHYPFMLMARQKYLSVYTTTTGSPCVYRNYAFCTQRMGARDISLNCMWSSLISLLAIFSELYQTFQRSRPAIFVIFLQPKVSTTLWGPTWSYAPSVWILVGY